LRIDANFSSTAAAFELSLALPESNVTSLLKRMMPVFSSNSSTSGYISTSCTIMLLTSSGSAFWPICAIRSSICFLSASISAWFPPFWIEVRRAIASPSCLRSMSSFAREVSNSFCSWRSCCSFER
jgi:hypothetical protein